MPETKVSYGGGRAIDYSTTVATAGSPNTHDLYTDLGSHYVVGGYIINDDTTRNLYVYASNDGTTYNLGAYTSASSLPTGGIAYTILKPGEGYYFEGKQTKKVKIDASGNAVAYRIHAF